MRDSQTLTIRVWTVVFWESQVRRTEHYTNFLNYSPNWSNIYFPKQHPGNVSGVNEAWGLYWIYLKNTVLRYFSKL